MISDESGLIAAMREDERETLYETLRNCPVTYSRSFKGFFFERQTEEMASLEVKDGEDSIGCLHLRRCQERGWVVDDWFTVGAKYERGCYLGFTTWDDVVKYVKGEHPPDVHFEESSAY